MAEITAFQVGILILSGAGAIQGQRAADKADDARKISQRQADLANQKRIRQAIEQQRIARAQVLSSGQAQTGGFDSSGIAGGVGAGTSQLASDIGFARTINAANRGISNALGEQAKAQSRQATFGALAALPGQLGVDMPDLFGNQKPGKPSGLSGKAVKTFGGK